MPTEHVKYSLMDYITGHLEQDESDTIHFHLQHCFECQNHYNELLSVYAALHKAGKAAPSSTYYSTILPRLQNRLMGDSPSKGSDRRIALSIMLPLTVSVLVLMLLIRIPEDYFSEHSQTEALYQAVKDYSADEVVQAISNEYTLSNVLANPEAVSAGIAEHLHQDVFLREALLRQIESGETLNAEIESILSGLDRRQTDVILSGLTEREML